MAITVLILCVIVNLFLAIKNDEHGNIKTAYFNFFSAGWCAFSLLNQFI